MRNEPIAIVGVSALFPGSEDEAGFWRDIVAGKDLITDVPASRWLIEDHYDPDPRAVDKTYCKRGAFLSPCSFDPLEFGVPPHAIPATDTCQLLSLVAAKRVLDDVARGQDAAIDRERASVILGVTSGQQLFLEVSSRMNRPLWVNALRESGIAEAQVTAICDRIAGSHLPWQENTFPGLLGNVVAGRIANRFDLHGTNCVTDAACASSLAAISMAMDELRLGRSDLVITGGADVFNDVPMFVAFSKTPALSPTGDCRPFSDRADGTVLGEGIAMFALKRLSDAERDGNHIYAVIRSIGSSSDGRSKSIYAPLPGGQARAMQRAYADAGYGPDSIELVEAHGTGTAAGDAAEIESLRMVFEPAANGRREWCALGSVKSQVGHTKAAAGAAALFKAAMALHHQALPPTIKVERPNPALQPGQSPFYINRTARPWIPQNGSGRRAAVSSFGFGGTNFHAVLEEYTGPNSRPKRIWPGGSELVLLSAADAGALRKSCLETAALCETEAVPLANVALASQYAFDASLPYRAAAVAADRQEMSRKLRHLADGKAAPGTHSSVGMMAGKIAFLFPGQGSQYLNMGAELAMTFPEAMAVWEQAADAASVVFPPRAFSPAEEQEQSRKLTSTAYAQPAVGAASASLLALLNLLEVRPDCVGGHSFGEIAALFAAGGIDLDTMLAIARRRGELMRESSTEPAGMLSVRSTWNQIRGVLEGLAVTPANHNGPAQVVLSGTEAPLDEAERRLRSAGFAVTALPVSTAFHSPLMRPAAEGFENCLQKFSIAPAALPFYSNRDGALHPAEGRAVAADLAQQIAAPVFFGDMIDRMYADGVRTFVEVGPRDVLTSLVGSILQGREYQAIALDRPGHGGLRTFWEGLGALAVAGIAMNWKRFRQGHRVSTELSRPSEPKLSVAIDGGNYGRPYPPPGGAAALPSPVRDAPVVTTTAKEGSTDAYRVFQESITAAHRDWQANLAKGHEAFLRSMEAALGSANGTRPVEPSQVDLPKPEFALPAEPVAKKAVETIPVPAASSRSVVWEVVADKTGYPADMLEAAMALEADLGIDSIKRVEILSALQERFPSLANMESASLVSLRTLGDIVTALDGAALDGASAPLDIASQPIVATGSARSIVWEVIADKTGYPADMLEEAMALEADLGIDSIKRVEIFSALQERFPSLANMESAGLVSLRTLGDIVAALDGEAIEKPEPQRPAPAVLELPKRYVVSSRAAPASGYAMLHPGDRVVISDDAQGVASALAGMLGASGYHATVGDDSSDADVWICLDESQWSALLFAKAAARRLSGSWGAFITVEHKSRPWAGGLSGLAKTAALEWPAARVKAIHMDADGRGSEETASALLAELLSGGSELEVELAADGSRLVPEIIETAWDAGDPVVPALLPSHPVIVATGGARGVTAACLQELAKTFRPRLVLFGRTALADEPAATRACLDTASIQNALLASFREAGRSVLPLALKAQAAEILATREVRDTLATLEQAGAQVRYFPVDVRDSSAVKAALAEVRREWGPIHGIVHAAGVVADKLIADLAPEQFEAVFSTKVDGLHALLDATAQDPIGVLCVFSSVAARYGNRGQAAYAMANEVLNRVAQAEARRRAGACIVGSINWGPWDSGMVTPALAKHFAAMNVALIELTAGAHAFVKELVSAGSDVEVVIGGPIAAHPADMQVRIQSATHPHLNDHVIQDVPVLPLVEAVGLMLRAAAEQGRMPQPPCCADVKVLRGIRLEGFHNGGNLLTVRRRGEATFELVSPDGTRHYEASLWPAADGKAVDGTASPPDPAPLSAAPWNETEIYNQLLFHGPEFHMIRAIEGVSDNGIAGTLRARNGERWRHGAGGYDPGMLDGGLQLARLWGFLKLGQATLPMRVAGIRVFRETGSAPIECRVSASAGGNRTVCDISFFTLEKKLLALMTGVEMYAAPGA